LKDKLDLLLDQLVSATSQQSALEQITQEVKGATTSMTSVPKPIKFLSQSYAKLKEIFEQIGEGAFKVSSATKH
jgi:26S proteasome regulatory subunit N1